MQLLRPHHPGQGGALSDAAIRLSVCLSVRPSFSLFSNNSLQSAPLEDSMLS